MRRRRRRSAQKYSSWNKTTRRRDIRVCSPIAISQSSTNNLPVGKLLFLASLGISRISMFNLSFALPPSTRSATQRWDFPRDAPSYRVGCFRSLRNARRKQKSTVYGPLTRRRKSGNPLPDLNEVAKSSYTIDKSCKTPFPVRS